jgi:hypothetical protein
VAKQNFLLAMYQATIIKNNYVCVCAILFC